MLIEMCPTKVMQVLWVVKVEVHQVVRPYIRVSCLLATQLKSC